MKNLFGFLKHLFFYGIIVSLILFFYNSSIEFVYVSIICWFISLLSHIIESKLENKSMKKIIIGV